MTGRATATTERAAPTPEQRLAADPRRSIWVAASAGTGKTRVLTDRVLRLMLDGAHPESILCLTFTRAAAAEMIERVEARLASWAGSDAQQLGSELTELLGEPAPDALLDRARQLFAECLELPRGLAIMTIHAWCATLLARFPLEAGVATNFATLDERTAAELMIEARASVLQQAASDPASTLGMAFATLATALSEAGLTAALREVLACRVRLTASIARHGGIDGLITAIWRAVGVEPGTQAEALVEAACRDGTYDAAALVPAANALLATGMISDVQRGRELLIWLNAAAGDRVRLFERHCSCFLTAERAERKKLATKDLADLHTRALVREQMRVVDVCSRIDALRIAERSEALLRAGVATLLAYAELKARAGGLDYDDLIERARGLLAVPGGAAWVLYKLDQQIEHVLVDEAQDTSPAQWAIVEALVDEFFAGAGASEHGRTLFVVGDEKQSIYSFQGADLANLRRVRERLRGRAGEALVEVDLDLSFRSGPAVLELVDRVFADPLSRQGVGDLEAPLHHRPWRADAAGLVEVWPLVPPPADDAPREPWPLPDVQRPLDDAPRRLADALAERICAWVDEPGEVLESVGRRIRPGDILVLLSRRGVLQELLIRALRRRGVPVAGADRLALTDHIAVQDLLALARVALLPEDDLSFACLLKSPLLGIGEEELFQLAHARGPRSLLERLRAASRERPLWFAEIYGRVERWLRRADSMPPFEFFTSVLGDTDEAGRTMRQRMLTRLGPDAAEPIETLLGQTLAFEEGHPASLQGFVHWLDAGATELKRDPEQSAEAVRVMTAHGAKGLEAPIVILADAGPQYDPRPGRLIWDERSDLPFWRARKRERETLTDRACEEERLRQREERRRLLYVALTRARDRLYIAGWHGKSAAESEGDPTEEPPSRPQTSWHELVQRAFARLEGVETVALGDGFTGQGLRYRRGVRIELPASLAPSAPAIAALPLWAMRRAPDEPHRPRPQAPSRMGDGDVAAPIGEERLAALRFGGHVHKLLQLVPNLPGPARRSAIRRYAACLEGMLEAERERLASVVERVLGHPELASLFGAAARAEQPIAGLVDGVPVSGQVDRLVVLEREVLVADFKTDHRPPGKAQTVPRPYVAQLGAYRRLLGEVYPDRQIRCALVWTESGEVQWLDDMGDDAGLLRERLALTAVTPLP